MAVPKKKMSKSRRDSRKNTWKQKVFKKLKIAISFARSSINKNFGTSFIE